MVVLDWHSERLGTWMWQGWRCREGKVWLSNSKVVLLLGRACTRKATRVSICRLVARHLWCHWYLCCFAACPDPTLRFAVFGLWRWASFWHHEFWMGCWGLLVQGTQLTFLRCASFSSCRLLCIDYKSRLNLLWAWRRHELFILVAGFQDRILPTCMYFILQFEICHEAFIDALRLLKLWGTRIFLRKTFFDILECFAKTVTWPLWGIGRVW